MTDNQTMCVYAYIPDMPDGKVDEASVVKKISKIKYKHSCRCSEISDENEENWVI